MMRQSLVYAKNVLRLVGVIEICLEDLARHLWYLLLSPGSPIQFPKFRKLVDQPRRWATIHISPPGLSQEGASVELSRDGKSSISSDCVSSPPISTSFIGGACSAACCLASNGSATPPDFPPFKPFRGFACFIIYMLIGISPQPCTLNTGLAKHSLIQCLSPSHLKY